MPYLFSNEYHRQPLDELLDIPLIEKKSENEIIYEVKMPENFLE
jgi:hypothetical protein